MRCLGAAGVPPAFGSMPVCDPGGGRNWSVSDRALFGLIVAPVEDESAGAAEVESGGAVVVESGGAVETESGGAAVESDFAAGKLSSGLGESSPETPLSGAAGCSPGGGSAWATNAGAVVQFVEATAGLPAVTANAAAPTNTRRSWRIRHAARRRIQAILDDARPDGDAKIRAG